MIEGDTTAAASPVKEADRALYAPRRYVESLADCLFYHTLDLPDIGTVRGFWDIRGRESDYLGRVDFAGRRVLEVGPGTGQMSFYMERGGANVVVLDAAEDRQWELFWDLYDPVPEEFCGVLELNRGNIERIKNSWWFCHRALGSNARAHYGDAYDVPRGLGEFDISVLACILLHNRNPLRILENCARVTREQIIVVELLQPDQLPQSGCDFNPIGRRWWDTWWRFSPRFFVDVLRSMGFAHSRVTFHTHNHLGSPADLFTVVATRQSLRDPVDSEDRPLRIALTTPVDRLRLIAGEQFHLPVRVANIGAVPIHSFSDQPLMLAYHWRGKAGDVLVWDGLRTALPRVLHPADTEQMLMLIQAPTGAMDCTLELTLVKEGQRWFDSAMQGLPVLVETVVVAS